MQSIIAELAAARKAVFDIVDDESVEEVVAESHFQKGSELEEAILFAPIQTQTDKLVARQTLYEGGAVDFLDSFKERLALRLLDLALA